MATDKPPCHPRPQLLGISEARIRLTELVNRAHFKGERFVLVRRGKVLAALVPATGPDEIGEAA